MNEVGVMSENTSCQEIILFLLRNSVSNTNCFPSHCKTVPGLRSHPLGFSPAHHTPRSPPFLSHQESAKPKDSPAGPLSWILHKRESAGSASPDLFAIAHTTVRGPFSGLILLGNRPPPLQHVC